MYKRTKSDSPLKCPYCDRQFTMNGRAYYYDYRKKLNETTCKHCGKRFLYRNISAQYAREHNLQATFKINDN